MIQTTNTISLQIPLKIKCMQLSQKPDVCWTPSLLKRVN